MTSRWILPLLVLQVMEGLGAAVLAGSWGCTPAQFAAEVHTLWSQSGLPSSSLPSLDSCSLPSASLLRNPLQHSVACRTSWIDIHLVPVLLVPNLLIPTLSWCSSMSTICHGECLGGDGLSWSGFPCNPPVTPSMFHWGWAPRRFREPERWMRGSMLLWSISFPISSLASCRISTARMYIIPSAIAVQCIGIASVVPFLKMIFFLYSALRTKTQGFLFRNISAFILIMLVKSIALSVISIALSVESIALSVESIGLSLNQYICLLRLQFTIMSVTLFDVLHQLCPFSPLKLC